MKNRIRFPYALLHCLAIVGLAAISISIASGASRPNIVLVMADDQGWGQVSYYNHPVLKTPHLDAMAANGLRFDRFYAGAPVCSPTRASVLTGRANDRTGVYQHGHVLRLQEQTLPEALRKAGYATGHFGKWHLNGLRGPGVPILGHDKYHPGKYGYEYWLSVTNFFDLNPVMSRNGEFEEFKGDSSVIIVDEALAYMKEQSEAGNPFFTTIWYGSPHAPMMASDEDRKPFEHLEENNAHHYGELVALDRSIGNLRRGLRELGIADNTLVWYCSDNGGLKVKPESVNGLRGTKGTVYEGGLRVPGIIEWPSVIEEGVISDTPASVLDMFPTIADIVGLPKKSLSNPIDGVSLKSSLEGSIPKNRKRPIPFRYMGKGAMVDNDYKLVVTSVEEKTYALYDLAKDPSESNDIYESRPEVAKRLTKAFEKWNRTVDASDAGKDYPEGKLTDPNPRRIFWTELPDYEPYFPEWKKRPEYESRFKGK